MMGRLLKNTLGAIINNIIDHESRVIVAEWEQERVVGTDLLLITKISTPESTTYLYMRDLKNDCERLQQKTMRETLRMEKKRRENKKKRKRKLVLLFLQT